jgi:hypothetical protein
MNLSKGCKGSLGKPVAHKVETLKSGRTFHRYQCRECGQWFGVAGMIPVHNRKGN